ncbi:DedA family protein/thiosulfate sulfurtransferase GlpE [[Pseudomonas] boreopolis]|uniref:Membrane protein n=1 Tax=Xanthomonas boreopolis TaxID=86183 RepID=A0A919F8B9_9XANT|nr:membrane protein [[Pseudomonas] boreopolis]
MQALLEQFGLALVFVNVLALSLGLPVPAMPTLIVVGAGFALQGGATAWFGCLAALALSVAASLLGDLAWYAAGRRYGTSTLRSLCRLSLSRDSCMKKTERFYGRWGVRVLAVAKFVPGLSMVSVPMAGAMQVRPAAFLRYDALGAALWALVGVGLGVLFHGQVGRVTSLLAELGSGAVLLVVALLVAYIGWRAWHRRALLRSLDATRIDVDELHALLQGEDAPVVLDIRAPGYRELEPFTIPGAVFADERRLGDILAAYPPERSIVIYCACPDEVSAAWLAAQLRKHRYRDVRPLRGGLADWRKAGYDVAWLQGASGAGMPRPLVQA